MTEDQATLFDDATLRDKLSRYLPNDLEIHVGRHELGGDWFVIIGVAAHRDGVVVFCGDGTFEERERPRTAFRKGEIFVRHGSKTERPNQDDIRALRDADSNEQAWLRQVETVADIVVEIGKLVEEERPARPDGRITHIGQPTRIPTMRARLRTSLETLARLGGPELPSARELADSSSYVFLDQLLGAVYVASAEISSVLQGVVVSAASHA
jgi:hypothetical protein